MSNFSELSYAPPELGETHGRFACPANTEHSKFLTSYELFKYHIMNCRQLRALGEVFICKFCTRLFKNPSKRDTHQFSCSCRMEKGNEVFEMPEKLRNKYTLNQLVFEDYNEVVAIVNNFPQNQPCSDEDNNSPGGLSNIDEDNDGTECKSDSKLEQVKKKQQDVHSCCDKESQLESHREQEQDLGDEEDLTELGQLRQIYQKNILLQQEQQQKQVREQQLQHQSQEETVNASILLEQLQAEEIINADQRESSLMIAEPNDDGTNQDRYNNSIQNPTAMIDLKKVNLVDSKQKYSQQAQNYEEEQATLLENQRKDDGNMLNNDGSLFQMDEEEGVTSNKDMKSSREIQLVSENEVAESDLENMQHQLGLLRVDNDQHRVSENEGCGIALSREDQKKPSQKASSRQLQGRQVVKLEEPSLVETNNQNQGEVSNNSDKDSNNNQGQPPNDSTSKDPSLCIERSDSKHQKNEELSSKIKEENQDEYDEFEDPITDLELTDQKIQKVVEVRVVELMRSITLKFKDPHQNDITSPILLAIHRKVFMKVDFSLVFMKFNETKDEKVLDCVDSLVCLGQNEIVFFTQFLQHLKAPLLEPLIFLSHNVPSICDFFSRGSLQLVSETLSKSEHIFVLIVELKQHPNFNSDLINYESIQISVRKYVGFSVWDKNQQQKVFHLSEEDLTEEYLKNIVEQYDPFSQETIIFDTLYSRELQTLSLEREQSMQHLLDKRERLCENRGQEQENELFRLKQESILERQINLKRTETQRITQAAVQIEQEIKQLLQQVSKFKAGLSSEIEKGFQRAKMQSDEIYESQITRHQADFLLLAKENTSEKIEYLNQLKAEHKNLIKEQLEVIYEQRKIGNLMLAYHQEEAELKRMVEQKDRQISMHKSQQQTAYPCVICRKYPQNCHQKPCGHVLCCFYCVSKENDSKGTIFCKLCKVEIIKFSEIKYKVG